jgi:mRNA interferase MazF
MRTVGHKQSGLRPYLVLSDERLHAARRMVIAVPMTTKPHPIPTHLEIAPGSYALCEQPKSFSMRRISKIEAKGYDVAPVCAVVNRLIGG